MSIFKKRAGGGCEDLQPYAFRDEAELQELLFQHPEIMLSVPELELDDEEVAFKYREYKTSRGPVDVLLVTRNGGIILAETKLLKNPEAIRTVVAQVVDYIKAITVDGCPNDVENHGSRCFAKAAGFEPDDRFMHLVRRNFETGAINALVIGDAIHPNILGLVDTIQAAPHLKFHLSLVKVETCQDADDLVITARTVETTKEVERSVITISFEPETVKPVITAVAPEKDTEGQKAGPKLTWDEFLKMVDPKYQELIQRFRDDWQREYGPASINMGISGFSASVFVGGKRLPLFLKILSDRMYIMTEKSRRKQGVSDAAYAVYRDEMKKSQEAFDLLLSGRTELVYDAMPLAAVNTAFEAALAVARRVNRELNGTT